MWWSKARGLVAFSALSIAISVLSPAKQALASDEYPSRTLRVLVGFPPGSGADILTRHFAALVSAEAGKPVIVENKPGANGNIAMGLATKAKPDGYTILFSSNSTIVAGHHLYKNLGFSPQSDLTPAGLFSETTFMLAVAGNSKISTVAELTAALKGNAKAKYGYTNQLAQIATEFYKSLADVPGIPVSYRTAADVVRDMHAGEIDFMIIDGTFGSGQVRAGRLKPLAVTTSRRHSNLPDVPTMQEAGYEDFDFSAWWGAYLPAGTDPAVVQKVGSWINKASKAESTRTFVEKVLGTPLHADRDSALQRINRETIRWERAVKAAGIQPQ